MKREEAYKITKDLIGCCISDETFSKNIIDKIYNDFENRTCENCKLNKQIDGFMIFCEAKNTDGYVVGWHGNTKDYGCNRWKAKDE